MALSHETEPRNGVRCSRTGENDPSVRRVASDHVAAHTAWRYDINRTACPMAHGNNGFYFWSFILRHCTFQSNGFSALEMLSSGSHFNTGHNLTCIELQSRADHMLVWLMAALHHLHCCTYQHIKCLVVPRHFESLSSIAIKIPPLALGNETSF